MMLKLYSLLLKTPRNNINPLLKELLTAQVPTVLIDKSEAEDKYTKKQRRSKL